MLPAGVKILKFICNKLANKQRPERTSAKASHQNYALQFSRAKNDPAETGVAKRFLFRLAKKENRNRAQSDTNREEFSMNLFRSFAPSVAGERSAFRFKTG